MKRCPNTGHFGHHFDAVSHQCPPPCGKYERGFAPPKEYKRPRAECQICERQQALESSGLLGHHGYKRKGWGFIEGDCTGVDHKPYPETDALVKYRELLEAYLERAKEELTNLPTLETITILDKKGAYTLKKGDTYRYDHESRRIFQAFDDVIEGKTRELEFNIENAKRDLKRTKKRIEEGNVLRRASAGQKG